MFRAATQLRDRLGLARPPAAPRTQVAVLAGKVVRSATRTLGRGGTALPGLLAERFDPQVVRRLAAQLDLLVLITGTNGKTTTSRMLAELIRADGRPVVHNRAGSNLMRGLAAALIDAAGPLGRLPAGAVGVFETDEATIPAAVAATQPRALLITNLMRDQLDRYGEIDAVRERWRDAIAGLPPSAILILNADDPSVATLAADWPGLTIYFGVDDAAAALPPGDAGQAAEALWDPQTGAEYLYRRRFYSHLGHWRSATTARPKPDVRALQIDATAPDAISFDLAVGPNPAGAQRVRLPFAGLYNVYNALAAVTAARVLEIDPGIVPGALGTMRAAFGRQETLVVDGHPVQILLAKNPAGMNEALRTLQRPEAQHHLLVLLNDGIADGTDVSWIWDSDWEPLAPYVASLAVAGTRAADMALRLSYAGFPAPHASVQHDIAVALEAALAALPPGQPLVILPTYTALLDVRERLGRRAGTARLWEEA